MIRVAVIGLPDLGMVLNGHPDLDVQNFPIGSAVGTTLGKVLRGVKPADVVFVVADDGGDQVADMLGALEKLPRPTVVIEGLDGKTRGRFASASSVSVPFTVNELVKIIDPGLAPIAGGDESIEAAVEVEEPQPVDVAPTEPEPMPWDMSSSTVNTTGSPETGTSPATGAAQEPSSGEAPTHSAPADEAGTHAQPDGVWDSAFESADTPAWAMTPEQPSHVEQNGGVVASQPPADQPAVAAPGEPAGSGLDQPSSGDAPPWASAVPQTPPSPATEPAPWEEPTPAAGDVSAAEDVPPWAATPADGPTPVEVPSPESHTNGVAAHAGPVAADPSPEVPEPVAPTPEVPAGEVAETPPWAATPATSIPQQAESTPPWASEVTEAPTPVQSPVQAPLVEDDTPPWADASPASPVPATPASPAPIAEDTPPWAAEPVDVHSQTEPVVGPVEDTPPWAEAGLPAEPPSPTAAGPESVETESPWSTEAEAEASAQTDLSAVDVAPTDLDPVPIPAAEPDLTPEPAVGLEAPWVSAPDTPASAPGLPTTETPWEAAPERAEASPVEQPLTEGNSMAPAEEPPPWAAAQDAPPSPHAPEPEPVMHPVVEDPPEAPAGTVAGVSDRDAPEWVASSGPSEAVASEPVYEKPFAESPPWEAGSLPLSMDDMMPTTAAQPGSDLPAWAASTTPQATPAAPTPQAPPAAPAVPADERTHPELPSAPMPEWAASTRGPNDLAPVPVEENPTFAHSPYADQAETGRSGRLGRVVAVVAAKGGVGKSTMSLWTTEAIGAALRSQDRRVALVDGNIGQPDISKMMRLWGQTPDLGHIADGRRFTTAELHEALVEVPELNATVLFGPKQPIKVSEEAALRALSSAVRLMRREFSWVVIDAPVGTIFEDVYRDFILHEADLLLVVVNPHETTLQDTASFLSEISQPVHLGGMAYPTDRAAVVLNKSSARSGLTVADVERRLPEYRVLGEIPEVASVLPAVNDGVYQAPTAAAQVIAEVVATMTGESVAVDPDAVQSRRKQAKEHGGGWGSRLRGMLSK